jgi:hypothetical protein
MFALIIGINIYKNNDWPNLRGAVSDAGAIESYLMDGLRVDNSRIRMLLDEDCYSTGYHRRPSRPEGQ